MLMRVLVIYDWPEDFSMAKHPGILLSLVEDLKLKPNKANFFVTGEKKQRKRTLFKKSKLANVLSEFTDYSWMSLDETIDGNYLNVNGHLSYDPGGSHKRYVTVFPKNRYSVNDALHHLYLVCRSLTPRYGFTHVEEGASAIYMTSGVATTSMPHDTWTRIEDLGYSLRDTKEHVTGKLHDVYEMNILSPAHLGRYFKGESLGSWIESGSRGRLIKIKEEVFAWIVPDNVRSEVRSALFREGVLIASV
jgi:hypothetical protein